MGDPIEFHDKEGQQLLSHLQSIRKEHEYGTEVWSDEKLELAAEGLIEYEKIINMLPEEIANKLDEPSIQNCFLGSVPVQHFGYKEGGEPSDVEVEKINQAFMLRGGKFAIVSYRYGRQKNAALINIKSATNIIKGNKDIFENVTDPESFLKTRPQEYLAPAVFITRKIHDQRHGVLSGYPRETVDVWASISNGLNINRFTGGPKKIGVGDRKNGGIYYEGFSEKDRIWVNEIIALKAESGISQIERRPDFK